MFTEFRNLMTFFAVCHLAYNSNHLAHNYEEKMLLKKITLTHPQLINQEKKIEGKLCNNEN